MLVTDDLPPPFDLCISLSVTDRQGKAVNSSCNRIFVGPRSITRNKLARSDSIVIYGLKSASFTDTCELFAVSPSGDERCFL